MERLKEIVALYLGVSPDRIDESTSIGRGAIPGSVMRHRMYSKISAEGYEIVRPSQIETFGDLLSDLEREPTINTPGSKSIRTNENIHIDDNEGSNYESSGIGIGIDIEEINNLPDTTDFRDHIFYIENFSPNEVTGALMASDPKRRFAGLFSLKEALCKANNQLLEVPFRGLEIEHSDAGQPFYSGFLLSNSYTEQLAIGIAIPNQLLNRHSDDDDIVVLRTKFRALRRLVLLGMCCIITIFVMTIVLVA